MRVDDKEMYNVSEAESYNREITFPRSLEVIPDILLKIQNEDCVRDTTIALEAMTRRERWTLESNNFFQYFYLTIYMYLTFF